MERWGELRKPSKLCLCFHSDFCSEPRALNGDIQTSYAQRFSTRPGQGPAHLMDITHLRPFRVRFHSSVCDRFVAFKLPFLPIVIQYLRRKPHSLPDPIPVSRNLLWSPVLTSYKNER